MTVNVGCPGPTITKPRHGAIVSSVLEVDLEEEACVSINGVERCGTLLNFADLPSGRVAIRASTGECLTTISVDVRSPIRDYERPLLVTAAAERYVTRRMLDNLVGSLHFWEPSSTIVVYDLGFTPASRSKVLRWRDVELRDLAPAVQRVLNETPPHTLQASSYAFKMIVIQDALRTARSVLWIDANCELRRPLDEVFHLLQDKGHFLVEHPYRFPTTQFHHPAAVSQLGCFIDDESENQDSTDFTKCLEAIVKHKPEIKRVFTLGALGGRLDHVLYNMKVLFDYPNLEIILIGDDSTAQAIPAGKTVIKCESEYEKTCCGLIPLQGDARVSTIGLKWNLEDDVMSFNAGGLISTSNQFVSDEVVVHTDTPLLFTFSSTSTSNSAARMAM